MSDQQPRPTKVHYFHDDDPIYSEGWTISTLYGSDSPPPAPTPARRRSRTHDDDGWPLCPFCKASAVDRCAHVVALTGDDFGWLVCPWGDAVLPRLSVSPDALDDDDYTERELRRSFGKFAHAVYETYVMLEGCLDAPLRQHAANYLLFHLLVQKLRLAVRERHWEAQTGAPMVFTGSIYFSKRPEDVRRAVSDALARIADGFVHLGNIVSQRQAEAAKRLPRMGRRRG
jgi:hypothetical protein